MIRHFAISVMDFTDGEFQSTGRNHHKDIDWQHGKLSLKIYPVVAKPPTGKFCQHRSIMHKGRFATKFQDFTNDESLCVWEEPP